MSARSSHTRAGAISAVCVAILLPAFAAAAQTGIVEPQDPRRIVVGAITDRTTSQPIEQARVQIVTTTMAVGTDGRGRFMIRGAPSGAQTLRVTRIGFRPETRSVTIPASDSVRVDIELTPSAVELAAVVTTGTGGAVEKKRVGSSLGTVDFESLREQLPVTDIGSALASKVTGLRSTSVGGGAGASKDLRIRGIASFSLNQRPVIYIDGVRIDSRADEWTSASGIGNKIACCAFAGGTSTDRLNDLNPEDIERVEVLKGAAASTLYGSEATNGVIQIFTKKGKNDSRSAWTVGLTGGFDRLRENLPTKLYPNFTGPDGTRARDANSLIESGPYQAYDLSVQGGGTRSTYFVSAGYTDQEGSIQPNYEKKGNLRINSTFLPTDKWTIEARSAFTRNNIAEEQAGNNWTALLGNAMNGDPRKASAARPFGEAWVPVADIKRMDTGSDANRWTGGITLNYALTPTFTHRVVAGMDAVNDEKSRFFPYFGDYGAAGVINGQRDLGYRNYRTVTFEYLGQFNTKLPMNIGSDLSFGAQGNWANERVNIAVGNSFAAPGVSTVSGAGVTSGGEAFSESVNFGGLAQERLSFGQKLYTTFGVRIDGNSAFGENYGYKTYPKADASWIVSEYGFLPKWVSSLKLRSAIGQAGKTPGAFDKFTTFTARSVFTGTPGVVPDNPGNADLRPETSTEIEGGFEAGLWSDRLGIEGSLYKNTTKDAIVPKFNAPSEGFQSARKINIGALENRGWEFSVNYLAVSRKGFDWSTNVRMDGNTNKVTDLGGITLAGNNVRLGYPIRGVWSRVATGFTSASGKPVTTASDTAVYLGPPLPTFNASFGNTVRFGKFSLYAMFTMERGAKFSNGDRPYRIRQGGSDEFLALLDKSGKTTFASDSLLNYYQFLDAIDSRDNVRFRELSLSYAIPDYLSGKANLGRTTLTLSGQNIMWWDHCHCVDPNMNWAGGDSFGVASGFLAQPAPRQFRFAIRSRF
jgi:TonB-dependent SusC/RagA subfamily outer membrane receptor